eukprot:scaffold35112_cov389-Skeletonema_dohrnii-CCMP3373.AAC.1
MENGLCNQSHLQCQNGPTSHIYTYEDSKKMLLVVKADASISHPLVCYSTSCCYPNVDQTFFGVPCT